MNCTNITRDPDGWTAAEAAKYCIAITSHPRWSPFFPVYSVPHMLHQLSGGQFLIWQLHLLRLPVGRREELGYRSGIVHGCSFPPSRILKGGTPITAWMPRAVRVISYGDSPESAPFDAVSGRNHSETRRLHSPPHPEAARSLARRSPHTLRLLYRLTTFRPESMPQPRPPRT